MMLHGSTELEHVECMGRIQIDIGSIVKSALEGSLRMLGLFALFFISQEFYCGTNEA